MLLADEPMSAIDVAARVRILETFHAIREANITYYIWGIPFTIRTTIQTNN